MTLFQQRLAMLMKVCYAITRTRKRGLKTELSLVTDDTGLQYLSFASHEEAKTWIRRLGGRVNYFEPNEIGPPSYAITEVGSALFCDAYKRARGAEWSEPTA